MMRQAGAVLGHLWGLFVDDGGMAAAAVAWLTLDALLSLLAALPPASRGLVLLAGLVSLLSWSCLRAARRIT